MIRDTRTAPSFDDFLQIGTVRPGEKKGTSGTAGRHGAIGRKFWIALGLLAICWMCWGAVLAHWLLLSDAGTPGSLHSVLLALLAAAGGLVTIMALSATRAMERPKQSPPGIEAIAGRIQAEPRRAPVASPAPPLPPTLPPAMSVAEPARAGGPPPLPPTRATEVIDEGEMMGRAYRLFSDGSIEVATLLGLRRFDSLMDARQFVGPGDRSMTV